MKTREETKKWLLENRVDDFGNLDLSELDFSDFDGDIYFNFIKVKNNLYQNEQKAGGFLDQSCQKVGGSLYQKKQEVQGNLHQNCQEVKGNLFQSEQEVNGNLEQGYQEVQKNLYQNEQNVKGNLWQDFQEVGGNLYQNEQEVKGDFLTQTLEENEEEITSILGNTYIVKKDK